MSDRWESSEERGFGGRSVVRGAVWRVALSVVAPIVWLAGTLLFYAFFAGGFSWVQDVVVGVVSALGLLATLLLLWLSFGLRWVGRWADV